VRKTERYIEREGEKEDRERGEINRETAKYRE
jgi:hypothetical protein